MVVVKKFGGTSLGSLERIEHVAQRVMDDIKKKAEKPIVVASAMSGETNRLIEMAHQISPSDRSRSYDMLLASGEQVSISLLSMALEKRGIAARPVLAFQMGLQTNTLHSKASITSIDNSFIQDLLGQGVVPVVAGFQGLSMQGDVTTLGRGGSDTSAVAIAAALKLNHCEIYTDVNGIYTADPRLIPNARKLGEVSFPEMMEMATLGSKVLHSRSVELGAKYGVSIHLRSTFQSEEGTWVRPEGEKMEKPVVTALTHDSNTCIVKMHPIPEEPDFLAQLFRKISEQGIIVDIITQNKNETGTHLAFSINTEDLTKTRSVLGSALPSSCQLQILENMAKVSVVGVGMQNQHGVAARFFSSIAGEDIPIHLVTTSDIKISLVIDNQNLEKAAQRVHDEFRLEVEDS